MWKVLALLMASPVAAQMMDPVGFQLWNALTMQNMALMHAMRPVPARPIAVPQRPSSEIPVKVRVAGSTLTVIYFAPDEGECQVWVEPGFEPWADGGGHLERYAVCNEVPKGKWRVRVTCGWYESRWIKFRR